MNVGVDEAGPDGVDADFLFGYLFRQSQSEGIDRTLGGGVVDVFVRRTEAGSAGGEVDDGAALASVLRGHAANGLAGAEETSKDIDGKDAVEAGGIDIFETRLQFDRAGVVDQRGDRAELLRGRFEEADHFFFVTHVSLDGNGRAVIFANRCSYSFRSRLLAEIVDADSESAGGGQESGGCSDAAAGSGDDQDLVRGRHSGGRTSQYFTCGFGIRASFSFSFMHS